MIGLIFIWRIVPETKNKLSKNLKKITGEISMKKVFFKYLILNMTIVFALSSCTTNLTDQSEGHLIESDTTIIDYWNGNRSLVRQDYERKILTAVLEATELDFGTWRITENLDEYPGNEEALVFSEKNHHLFITIAGNKKFDEGEMIVVPESMTKNLLGYRIPIIREEDVDIFSSIQELPDIQSKVNGIPISWSDAVIFRENGYEVVEDGDFDDIFERLKAGKFDYTAFGANEIQGVFENRASKHQGLTIDTNLLLFYQFPLVFYINPEFPNLAKRIEIGMQNIKESGRLDSIFDEHYGNIVEDLNLDKRILFILDNPLIPDEFKHLKPDLENL